MLVTTATLAERGAVSARCVLCVSGVAVSTVQVHSHMKLFFVWGCQEGSSHRPQLVVAASTSQALLRWRDSGMIAGATGRLRPPGFALEFAAGRDT